MDPCLDDCVMLAKKLKRLGRQVHLQILEGLPHGFLNFTMVRKLSPLNLFMQINNKSYLQLSNEAMDGSKLCIKSLQALLQASKDNDKDDDSTAYDATSSPSACSAASPAP